MAAVAAAVAAAQPITAPGPQGSLAGTFLQADDNAPVVLVIPGSGPTDRDGNNPLGVSAAPYRLLAEALAKEGVSTVRIDKRGMFESKAAVADANAVTLSAYASDAQSWIESIRKQTGASCVWLMGHSEGALVALTAAQKPDGICGLILVSGPGRKLGEIIRDQLKSNPANAPVLDDALRGIASLEAGKPVDVTSMPAPLQRLFAPQVQPFLMDMMAADPTKLAASTTLPILIAQGGRDLQVSVTDAEALSTAQPQAKLVLIPLMNHVLKDVGNTDRAGNLATYADPSLPVDQTLVTSIAEFVKK